MGRAFVAVRAGVLDFVVVLVAAFVLVAGALVGVFALVCVLVVFDGVFESLRLEVGEDQVDVVSPGLVPLVFEVRFPPVE